MPLYEYECTRCHKRVEKIQSFSAEPLTTCEFCGGPLERLISAPAIQFKGSGWYITDYAKGSGSVPAGSSESKSGENSAGDKSSSSNGDKPSSSTSSPSSPKSGE